MKGSDDQNSAEWAKLTLQTMQRKPLQHLNINLALLQASAKNSMAECLQTEFDLLQKIGSQLETTRSDDDILWSDPSNADEKQALALVAKSARPSSQSGILVSMFKLQNQHKIKPTNSNLERVRFIPFNANGTLSKDRPSSRFYCELICYLFAGYQELEINKLRGGASDLISGEVGEFARFQDWCEKQDPSRIDKRFGKDYLS